MSNLGVVWCWFRDSLYFLGSYLYVKLFSKGINIVRIFFRFIGRYLVF